jgi:4-hydroxybenzoyl-CoA reductase beta subunit
MISAKTYTRATSVEHAIAVAKAHDGTFRYLAGGTDVMVNKFQDNDDASLLIDISGIDELTGIYASDTHIIIGSMVTLDDLEKSPVISGKFPAIIEAAHSVASPTIRKTATLGGNLLCENRCSFYNQSGWWRASAGYCLKCSGATCLASGGNKNCFSRFVSDTAVALISLSASIEVADETGITVVPLESIYSGNGIHPRLLKDTPIIKSIMIPAGEFPRTVYKKLRKRESVDFTSLTTAVSLYQSGRIRLVLGGIHSKPVVVDGYVTDQLDDMVKQAISDSRVVGNDTYSRAFRKAMIPVFLNRSFRELMPVDERPGI